MTDEQHQTNEQATSRPRRESIRASSPLLTTRIARTLSVEPGEELRTSLLFVLLFLASMVFVMGRTARDALFLTQFPVTWIAYMWVAYGVVSSGVAIGYTRISGRFGREQLTIAFAVMAAISYVGVRVAVGLGSTWSIAFFYVWAEVVANLFVLQAWAITNDLHDPRSARRLFGLIGAGRIVGMLLSGFVAGALVRAIGTPNLIIVVAGLMVAFAGLVRIIGRKYQLATPAEVKPESSVERAPPKPPSLRRHMVYTSILSAMLLVVFVALTVGDYQFKAIAKVSIPDRDALAGYMAGFYAAMGAIAFVFQVFITPRILKHLGVMAALFTMPAAFLSSTAVLLFWPALPIATILKLSDNGLQYTIHDATMQLLYFAFPASVRTRVRALLDAMIKPLGYSLGGVVLVFLSPAPVPGETTADIAARIAHVGLVTLGLGVVWVTLVPFVRRAYVNSLQRSLARRQSDLHAESEVTIDAAMKKLLLETVQTGQPAQIVYAIERLVEGAPDVARGQVPTLIRHAHPSVRAFAIGQAVKLLPDEAADLARAMLADPSPDVRSAALGALGATRQEESVEEIEHFAYEDSRPNLRNKAIVTLIIHGGLPGVLAGGARLQQMLRSDDEVLRMEAAVVIGEIGQPSLARTLKPLLADESLRVRRAAAFAASGCSCDSLVEPMLDAMADRSLIKPLIKALVAVGPPAIDALEKRLANEDTTRLVRLSIPRILHRIGDRRGLEILRRLFGDPDEGVRQKCLASASRLRQDLQAAPMNPSAIASLIEMEIADHVKTRDGYLVARTWFARPLLDLEMQRELRGHVVRIMRLCEQAYSIEHVAAARGGIFSRDMTKRANALEVLDNVLSGENRQKIVAMVDRYATGCQFLNDPEPRGPISNEAQTWFEKRLSLPGHYRRSLLFEAVATKRLDSVASHALAYARRPNPFMRECSLLALAACRPEGWREEFELARRDNHPVVQTYARYVLSHDRDGLDMEDDMYTTVEKILYLQGVPLFSSVPGNELMPLAMRSQVLHLAPGEVVFREGDPGNSLFVVFHGQVALARGEERLALLGVGEVVGEMAILDEAPRLVTATAVDDVDLLRVSAEDFRLTLQDTAEFADRVISVLASRLRDLMDRRDGVRTEQDGRKTLL